MVSIKLSVAIFLFCTIVKSEPPVTSYGVPFNNNNFNNGPTNTYGPPSGPSNNYGAPNNNGNSFNNGNNNFNNGNNGYDNSHYDDGSHDHSEPKSYEFGYAVKDDYTGNDYKRRETSDGNQVNGEYRVQLPDGRTQIVTYYADWKTGFHADVRYEGTANFPDKYQTGNGYQNGGYQGNQGNQGYQNGGYQSQANYQNQGNQAALGLQAPSNQYGAPFPGSPATSSVSIKDFSGPGTPFNTGFGNGNGIGNGYDSYANAGNFGNRPRPSTEYGAP